jgi:death-on-curing protein
MIFSVKIVIRIHDRLIETSGGEKGIKDINLLDSAINSIYQTYDSKELYPTILEKAARL